jgi:cytochrome c oxidase cbb3-type subunit 3
MSSAPRDDVTEVVELEIADAPLRDGIAEEDNPIPLWFNVGFYGMLVVGVIYMIYYLFSGWSAHGQWEVEVARARERAALVEAELPTENPYRGDAAALEEGAQVWATVCAACHKPDGSGLVGPSLVDPYWKYGNSDSDLFETVTKGRPGGMPAWGTQLGSEKLWKALVYMETLPKSDQPGLGSQ